jgi:DUF971 family protein
VGHYAIKPVFSDGHESGLYTWDTLYRLGRDQDTLWQAYFDRLRDAGMDRDAPMAAPAAGCGHH